VVLVEEKIVVVRMAFVLRVRNEGEKRVRDLLCGIGEMSGALLYAGPVRCGFGCQ
jgi:predicted RNA methylase